MSRPEGLDPTLENVADLLATSGGVFMLAVRGESMLPTIEPGHAVRVRFGPRLPRLGELLVFRQADYLAVHRFLGPARTRSGERCLRTRGDGVSKLDPALLREDVLGSVVAIERADGWRKAVGPGPRGYALALALHDLCWAALAVLAARLGGRPLQRLVERLDRGLLGLADRLFFRLLHARLEASDEGRL